MKYVSKNIQQYFTEEQKDEYKQIKKRRNEFIRKNPLPRVKMYAKWNGKTWYAVPTRRSIWYIENKSEKEVIRSHFDRIKAFDEEITRLERHGMENKEIEICKAGNMIKRTTRWSSNENYIIQGKESRDYYSLIRVSDMRIRIMKWADIVKYFDLSDISK